jgi:hypothetical protein
MRAIDLHILMLVVVFLSVAIFHAVCASAIAYIFVGLMVLIPQAIIATQLLVKSRCRKPRLYVLTQETIVAIAALIFVIIWLAIRSTP